MPDFVLYLHRFFEGFLAIASYKGTFIHLDWSISFIEKVGLRRLKKKASQIDKIRLSRRSSTYHEKYLDIYNMKGSNISGQPRH